MLIEHFEDPFILLQDVLGWELNDLFFKPLEIREHRNMGDDVRSKIFLRDRLEG